MYQPNDAQFATAQLATGLRLQYAERGDPTGEAIVLLHGYSDGRVLALSFGRPQTRLKLDQAIFSPLERR